MSILAAVPTASLAFGRIMNVLMDQQVLDDTGLSQGERKFVLQISAFAPQVAKAKARIFTLGLRPKRKIVSIEIGVLEEGIILKKYQLIVITELFKKTEEDTGEE